MTNFSFFADCILPGDPGRNHGSGRKSQFAVVGHLGFAGFTSTDYSRIAISIHGRNSSSSSTSPTSTPNLALACQEGVAVRIAGGVVHLAHADRPITQVIAALLVNISDESSDDNFDPSMFLCLSMKM